jgi:hypothetical protein
VAAGAGTWAALGGAVYGYLFGWLAVMAVSIVTLLLAISPLHLFGGGWGSLLGTTTVTLVALAVGAYAAGRKLTATAAARSGYRAREARRLTAMLGGGLVLTYALSGWRGALDWPNVVLLLSLPVWFVAGAWHAAGKPFPTRRWQVGVLAVVALVVPATLALGMGTAGVMSGGASFRPSGTERIALPQPASMASAITSSGGPLGAGLVTIYAEFDDPSVQADRTWARLVMSCASRRRRRRAPGCSSSASSRLPVPLASRSQASMDRGCSTSTSDLAHNRICGCLRTDVDRIPRWRAAAGTDLSVNRAGSPLRGP